MKTPFELRKQYKEETGNSFLMVEYALKEIADDEEWNCLTVEQYIEWLESKIYDPQINKDLFRIVNEFKT